MDKRSVLGVLPVLVGDFCMRGDGKYIHCFFTDGYVFHNKECPIKILIRYPNLLLRKKLAYLTLMNGPVILSPYSIRFHLLSAESPSPYD